MVSMSTMLRVSFLLIISAVAVLSAPNTFEDRDLAEDGIEFLDETKRSLGIPQILQNDASRARQMENLGISKTLQNDANRARQMEETLKRNRANSFGDFKLIYGRKLRPSFLQKVVNFVKKVFGRRRTTRRVTWF